MRRESVLGVLAFFLVAASCFAAGSVRASDSSSFMAWATSRSSECDTRWARISAPATAVATASPGTAQHAPSGRRTAGESTERASELSHTIVDQTNFIHPVGGDFDLLGRTTRERGDAARGQNTLRSPADAHLNVPYSVRRPLNSSVEQKNFFHSMGDVTRPRLKSFGRMHTGTRMYGRVPARPSYRAARPRVL